MSDVEIEVDDDRLEANPFALARLLLASRVRGFGGARGARGLDEEAARRVRAWGVWLDLAIEAGFGSAEVMASVPRATFALTVWGERAGLEALLGLSGIGEVERVRFTSLAAQAGSAGAWLLEDDEGFEGGFALSGVSAAAVRALLPGDGVARAMALAGELGLGDPDEVWRTVNPGGEATELVLSIPGEPANMLERAWRALLGSPAPGGIALLLGHASGPASLVLKAGERGVTALGARVPIASSTGLAAGLAAVGAGDEDDERLAATLGTVGVALPAYVDVIERAHGLELRAWLVDES